ncbi:hypothetical protein B0O99DRAFT_218436 [Bisporella sp. PMI_857]|nr:hypothetical protein B0O99DRAFT_218436 [Bisporella sp. PMI_857]
MLKQLYNLIAQNDSNSQMQIANSHVQMAKSHVHIAELQAQIVNSAAKDNAQVKTLTYLGIFFLPANLIAALLGIQGYEMTGKLFLIFLAYTVPFGILVFGAFNLHMWWRKRRQTKLARRGSVMPEISFNPQQNEDIEMRDMQRRDSVAW